ncbi:unnamed protein product [Cuscuta campestris]|uniref:Uncharacterized protein n=1 Tax=Cuscuta campestris TaxID=132261 RepID=A0A484MYN0_9ASTE|nr:unnamed protein product [Cuscuta campestris]
MYEKGTDSVFPSENWKGAESATDELCSRRPSGLTTRKTHQQLDSSISVFKNGKQNFSNQNTEVAFELALGYEEKYDKDSLPVFVKENWSKSVVCYTSVVERKMPQFRNGSLPLLQTLMIPCLFHGGAWAFLESLRIQSLGKDLVSEKKKLVKGGKTSNTLRYTGFVLPSSFLLFECINDFGETFGVKMEQTNPALPRMCIWKNKISKKPSHEAIINALNAAKSVRSILLPEGSEIRAPWITPPSLPSVSNPTLGEFVRGIQGGDKHIQLCLKKQLLAPASEDEVAVGRNSSSDEVHSSSEGSEVPSKKYVFRRRKISKLSTPLGKAEHRPLLETQSPQLERTTNINASSFSGNSSQNLPDSLKDYIDGKFSELQKRYGRTDEAKEDGNKEEPVQVNMVDHSIFEGVDHNEEEEIKDGKEEDGKVEEPVEVNMVDPYSFEWVDHNEEEIKDGKEEDGKEEVGKEEDEPMAVNMVNLSSFEGIPKEKEEEEGDQFNLNEEEEVKDRSPPIQEEEEEKFAVEGETNEDEMAMSDKIVHDVVEFCKSTENNVDEKLESDGDVLRELTDVDEVAAARELGRGLREKKRSIHISSPYFASFANVHKKVKVINNNELDKAEEAQLNIRRNPSSQQLEAFHQFIQSAIADGREVQCIMEKRGESHGIVKKWSSLIKAGGWLETSHMKEIMIYFMKMYNKKDSTYAVLPESFQMLSEVNATTELFPILDTGLTEIVLGRRLSSSPTTSAAIGARQTFLFTKFPVSS